MIQDIEPRINIDHMANVSPAPGDVIFAYHEGMLYELKGRERSGETRCLFSIGDVRYFGCVGCGEPSDGELLDLRKMRRERSGTDSRLMASFTAFHLLKWYDDNKFCGRCGGAMAPSGKERALICVRCGHTVYPRINPAVIVGVIKGDSLLLVNSLSGYGKDHPVLVSGFAEIGECLEDTVKREVKEETGLEVDDVRYFASQPWGMAEDLLVGFFCRCISEKEPEPEQSELRRASFVKREDIKADVAEISLTNAMMGAFARGEII